MTALAALYLGLALGGNTAVFWVVDSILLHPLPVREPDRLFMVSDRYEGPGSDSGSFGTTRLNFLARRSLAELQGSGALLTGNFSLTGDGQPEHLAGVSVSSDFFPTLGIRPVLGRSFLPEEERPGAARVALVSHALWSRHFGSDPGVINRTITLDEVPYTVVGVLPAGFYFPYVDGDVWVPLTLDPADLALPQRSSHELLSVARLAPGVSLVQARAALKALASRQAQSFPDSNKAWTAEARSLQEYREGDLRPRLLALQLAAVFVLLIVCANLSSLLLVRGEGRAGELAVRLALGASRSTLMRLLLAESFALALLGVAVGLVLAAWFFAPIVALAPVDLPQPLEGAARLDYRVVIFGLAMALVAALVSGLAPVLRSFRRDSLLTLRQGSRTAGSRASQRFLDGLAVAELALAVMLLVGAGLMFRSFRHLTEVNPGFDSRGAVTAVITLPKQRYAEPHQRIELLRRVLERAGNLPGVSSTAATTVLPMGNGSRFGPFRIQGQDGGAPSEVFRARYVLTSPGYLATMRIPLLEGRSFTDADGKEAPGVVIVSRAMARRFWPGRSPLGTRIQRGRTPAPNAPWLTVVGVAEDVHDNIVSSEVEPMYYLPYAQHAETEPARTICLVVRGPETLAAPLRREVWAIDRELPLYQVLTLEELLTASLSRQRFSVFLLGWFAGLSLLLVIVGVYCVTSFYVSQQGREMGIRQALGARPSDVLALVLWRGSRLMVLGVVLGLAGALALARFLSSQLYRVEAADPWTLVTVAAGLVVVALTATYLPARRAARVDPAIVLKA